MISSRANQQAVVHWVALVTAVALQFALIIFGILRTDTVVRVNNVFPFADKLWHCIYYAVLSLLLWHAARRHTLAALVLLVSLAALDEAIQAFTPGRSASWFDLGVDIAVGVATITIARRVSRAR